MASWRLPRRCLLGYCAVPILELPAAKGPSWYYDLAEQPREMWELVDHRMLVDRPERWDSGGRQQLDFMQRQGLEPQHKLLDLGCGALRGGLHFVRFLERGNYYGIDINKHFLDVGLETEIKKAGLKSKLPNENLLVSDICEASRFGVKFDFVFAYSMWTHLPGAEVKRCLKQVADALSLSGVFFATFFLAPPGQEHAPVRQNNYKGRYLDDYGEHSYPNRDPYHHTMRDLKKMALDCGLSLKDAGTLGPDNHHVAEFRLALANPNVGVEL